MNEHPSGSLPAITPRTISAPLYHAMQRDPLVVAVGLGLLPATSYDDAWDALEAVSPDRYQPSVEVQDWLRANWRELNGGESLEVNPVKIGVTEGEISQYFPPSRAHARPWMAPFLAEYIRNGGVILQAAKVALVNRDTVAEYRKHDPAFARAMVEADEERRRLARG